MKFVQEKKAVRFWQKTGLFHFAVSRGFKNLSLRHADSGTCGIFPDGPGAPRGWLLAHFTMGGIEVMRREVSMYLLGEQELEYTFKTIEEELAKLRVR